MILLPASQEDLIALEQILASNVFETPTLKLSVYKNRRGRHKGVYLWCKADLGCCRVQPMFATTYNHDLINMNDLRIRLEEESAF